MAVRRLATPLFALLVTLTPVPARADWLLIPFLGVRFSGSTSLVDLEQAAGDTSLAIGGSVALLGGGVVGVEGDVGWIPGFFESGSRGLVTSSRVTSLTGNLILAVPISMTRESLRPYVVAGAGVMHAVSDDILGVLAVDSAMPAITLGGGAIGFLTDKTGVRFDARYVRSLGQGDDLAVAPGHRLGYWRGSIGIVRRF